MLWGYRDRKTHTSGFWKDHYNIVTCHKIIKMAWQEVTRITFTLHANSCDLTLCLKGIWTIQISTGNSVGDCVFWKVCGTGSEWRRNQRACHRIIQRTDNGSIKENIDAANILNFCRRFQWSQKRRRLTLQVNKEVSAMWENVSDFVKKEIFWNCCNWSCSCAI